MLLSFLIVFFLLKKYAWKPVLLMVKKREESIEQALKDAEKARISVERMQADHDRILSEACAEREIIFREAQAIKEKIVGEARELALIEKDKIMKDAHVSIEAEKNAAIREIRNTAAGLSVQIAEKILHRELSNDQKQRELIEQMIKEIPVN
jgi:F-type H+-transporting ATPase subunit b